MVPNANKLCVREKQYAPFHVRSIGLILMIDLNQIAVIKLTNYSPHVWKIPSRLIQFVYMARN